jgi:hypothetical protein
MTKTLAALSVVIVALTGASAAMAESARKPRPKTCEQYSEATTSTGGKIGICAPTKAGGKPTYLSRYNIVTITAGDGVATKVMIGYR